VIRAGLVLVPVVWLHFGGLNLYLLFTMAIAVAALNAFFEPAMQAVVPRLVADRQLLQATNGLMGTTSRLARAVGPAVVGALTGVIPTIHFFTLDSLSFGVSAFAIARLKRDLPPFTGLGKKNTSVLKEISSGFEIARGDRVVGYILCNKAITSGVWNIVLPLGVALLVQKLYPGDVRAFGFLLASYGVGNVISAVVLSNVNMIRPLRVMCMGAVLMGACFTAMAFAPTFFLKAFCLALGAVGGPMGDLGHLDVFQHKFPDHELVRVVRFRMAIEYGGMCVCLIAAPLCYKLLSPECVIEFAGLVMACVGIFGWLRYGE
jgi:DHA3 family macrolide efflux protein-like MFS transporter